MVESSQALLFEINFSLQYVMNVSFLILAHHASLVIVCPRHSTIRILKLLYFKKVVWIILETTSDRGKQLLDPFVSLRTALSLIIMHR